MTGLSAIALVALSSMGVCAAYTDIRYGIVKNRLIVAFCAFAVVMDIAMIALDPSKAPLFFLNSLATIVLSLVLFFTHTWAGGDAKLTCVMALLYPPEAYPLVQGVGLSLPLAVVFSFCFGIIFELCRRIHRTAIACSWPSPKQVGASVMAYAKLYICALACMVMVHFVYEVLISRLAEIQPLFVSGFGACLIWIIASQHLLEDNRVLVAVLCIDVVGIALTRSFPMTYSAANCVLVVVLIVARVLLSQPEYEVVPSAEVRKGMIISAASISLMLRSDWEGLPRLATEDLRSRLSDEQAQAVREWGRTPEGSSHVAVVNTIPFAAFVFAGFMACAVIGVVQI